MLASNNNVPIYFKVTPIKFREGKLIPDNSLWISNDNTPASINMRQPFFLLAPDVPTRFKGQSVIDTSTNQYLAFDTTSPEKDVRFKFRFIINLC